MGLFRKHQGRGTPFPSRQDTSSLSSCQNFGRTCMGVKPTQKKKELRNKNRATLCPENTQSPESSRTWSESWGIAVTWANILPFLLKIYWVWFPSLATKIVLTHRDHRDMKYWDISLKKSFTMLLLQSNVTERKMKNPSILKLWAEIEKNKYLGCTPSPNKEWQGQKNLNYVKKNMPFKKSCLCFVRLKCKDD